MLTSNLSEATSDEARDGIQKELDKA